MYIDPGVYTTVRDETEYANLGGGNVFAVVGTSTKGFTDTPIKCYGEQDLINKVGKPLSSLPDYAVQAAIQYMKRGSTVIFVRVSDGTETEASVTVNDYPANTANTIEFTALSPGTWGNDLQVGVDVDGSTEYSEVMGQGDGATTAFDSLTAGLNNLTPPTNVPIYPGTVTVSTTVSGAPVVLTDNGDGTLAGGGASTIDYISGELSLNFTVAPDNLADITITYRKVQHSETHAGAGFTSFAFTAVGNPLISYPNTNIIQPNTLFIMEGTGDSGGDLTTIGHDDGAGNIVGTNIAAGSTVNYATGAVTVNLTVGATAGITVVYMNPYFQVYVMAPVDRHGTMGEVERFVDLVMDSNSERFVEDVINDGVVGETAKSAYITADVPMVPSGFIPMSGLYSMTGGSDGTAAITDADYIGSFAGGSATGLQVLANPEETVFDEFAVPGVTSGAVIAAGIAVAEGREDCIYIADAPFGLGVQGVIDWHNGVGYSHAAFNSVYATLYWSWVKIYDSYNRTEIYLPPSGFAAAQYAYTDNVSYPWYAAAGTNRGVLLNALEVEYSPSKPERDQLYGYPNAVNSLVDFSNTGIVIWGQKTLYRRKTSRDRVNVVRMICYATRAIKNSVDSLVFDQNNEFLWARFKALVNPILQGIAQAGGLDSYEVVCDASTNPPSVRAQKEMHARVVITPTESAEKIVVEFVLERQTS